MKVLSLTVAVPMLRPPPLKPELPVKVLSRTVNVPSLTRPPPPKPMLLVKVQPLTVAVPKLLRPPATVQSLLAKVLSLTVNVPPLSLLRPPPKPPPPLLVKALSRTVAVPPLSLSMPPPLQVVLPATLFVRALLLTVNVPKLSMPPPLVPSAWILPPAIARPEMLTVSPGSTLKMRNMKRGIPLHGRGPRPQTIEGDTWIAQVRQDTFQGDRAGCHDVDDVLVGWVGIGLGDRSPKGAGPGIGQQGDLKGDGGEHDAFFDAFQG